MDTTNDGRTVTFDLYKDIHKAIRSELFATTVATGSLDPWGAGREALAARVGAVVGLLVSHAEHEDEHVQPLVEKHVPGLAARIEADHVALDRRMLGLGTLAEAAAEARAGGAARWALHDLYLELASFTAAYLDHIDVEERRVMPALCAEVPVPGLLAVHEAIVTSIPPDEMASSLALMLPAQNLDDRAELLAGMRASAPPEVFDGVLALAGSVLPGPDVAAVRARLGAQVLSP